MDSISIFGIFSESSGIFSKFPTPLARSGWIQRKLLWIHLLREIGHECGCNKFPHWGYENSGVWPKGEYGKGEYGKGTFRADQFGILGTYGQWLGMTCSSQAQ